MVFNFSYGSRVIWDILPYFVYMDWYDMTFVDYVVANMLGLIWDFIPMGLILVLHRKNLQAVEKNNEGLTEVQSYVKNSQDDTAMHIGVR